MLIHADVFERKSDRWFILHTMSNQETHLAGAMRAMNVAYFLPLRRVIRTQGGRQSSVMAPLFPSYIFIRGCLDDVYRADRTKRVARVVNVFDQDGLEMEIRALHQVLANNRDLSPHPHLKAGVRVEVRSGPLRGVRGLIENHSRDNRLIVQVEILGQATSLEIDCSLLEPI